MSQCSTCIPSINGNSCDTLLPMQCSNYSGSFIIGPQITTGMDTQTVILKLIEYANRILPVGPTTSSTSTTFTTRSTTTTTSTTRTTTSTTTTSSTTGNTTTSTSTSSTTSTTTTTTTSTSSSTTTTTTTILLNNIYYSAQSSSVPPSTSGAVTAGTLSNQNAALNVIINWQPLTGSPKFCWVAIPDLNINCEKNFWATAIQNGNIGTPDDLFNAPTQVVISAVTYNVYITNFATEFTSNCTLSH